MCGIIVYHFRDRILILPLKTKYAACLSFLCPHASLSTIPTYMAFASFLFPDCV